MLAALSHRPHRVAMLEARRANGAGRRPVARVDHDGDRLDPVLVLPDDVVVPADRADDAIAALGGEYRRASTVLNGAAVRLVATATRQRGVARAVRDLRNGGVRATANHVVMLGGTDKGGVHPDNTAVDIGTQSTTDDGPLVIVVDTGIDAAAPARGDGWLDHVVPVDPQLDIDPLHPLDQNGNPRPGILDLGAGHGTFVAGVVRQVAPDAQVRVIRALDTDGTATELEVAEAILRAADAFHQAPDQRGILNLSLGFETIDEVEPVALRVALDALPPEVIVVAAAGNAPTGIKLWPAAFDDVIGVGSHRGDDPPTASAWSNDGDSVTVSARGECVVSTFVAGREIAAPPGPSRPLYDPTPDTFNGPSAVAVWTGTSFAAPQVTGALADRWHANPSLSKADVIADLMTGNPHATADGPLLQIL